MFAERLQSLPEVTLFQLVQDRSIRIHGKTKYALYCASNLQRCCFSLDLEECAAIHKTRSA